jgi:hypothetical protein
MGIELTGDDKRLYGKLPLESVKSVNSSSQNG